MKDHTCEFRPSIETLEVKCVELSSYSTKITQTDLAMRISYLAGVRDALENVNEITQIPSRFKKLMRYCVIKTAELMSKITT